MQEYQFEIVRVNDHGEITERATHVAQQFTESLGGGVTLEMILIPGGTFWMGSRAGEGYADEHPQRTVRVAPFFMGKYSLMQEQWQAVMGSLPPCRCKGMKRPVDRISWNAARGFCERLADVTARKYRLPSEAEWEYACRAQTTTPFYFGETITTDLANYVGAYTYRAEPKGVYRHQSTEGGTFPPNAFGLYDMHGNVWEWCADAWYDDYDGAPTDGSARQCEGISNRVLRGGCWHDPPGLCLCASRLKQAASEGEDFFGLRVAFTSLEPDVSGVGEKVRLQPVPAAQRALSTILSRLGRGRG